MESDIPKDKLKNKVKTDKGSIDTIANILDIQINMYCMKVNL